MRKRCASVVREELTRSDLECPCEAEDVVERDVAKSALDLADVVLVQAGKFGEPLLSEAALHSQFAHAFAETHAVRRSCPSS